MQVFIVLGLMIAIVAVIFALQKLAALETERNSYQQRAEPAEKEMGALEEQLASLSVALEKHPMDLPAQ